MGSGTFPSCSPAIAFPTYSPREQLADRCIHFIGLIAGSSASATLLAIGLAQDSVLLFVGLALYGAGLVAMLGCSALYHMTGPSDRKERLRRVDHAAIFIMIAGTYTPFALIKIGGGAGLGLLAFVWCAAIGGALVKLVYPHRGERLFIALYLLLGWSIVVVREALFASVSRPAIVLLAAGGLLYSSGVVFHLWKRLPYHNAIWHGFVLAGAGCHFAAVLGDVALSGGSP